MQVIILIVVFVLLWFGVQVCGFAGWYKRIWQCVKTQMYCYWNAIGGRRQVSYESDSRLSADPDTSLTENPGIRSGSSREISGLTGMEVLQIAAPDLKSRKRSGNPAMHPKYNLGHLPSVSGEIGGLIDLELLKIYSQEEAKALSSVSEPTIDLAPKTVDHIIARSRELPESSGCGKELVQSIEGQMQISQYSLVEPYTSNDRELPEVVVNRIVEGMGIAVIPQSSMSYLDYFATESSTSVLYPLDLEHAESDPTVAEQNRRHLNRTHDENFAPTTSVSTEESKTDHQLSSSSAHEVDSKRSEPLTRSAYYAEEQSERLFWDCFRKDLQGEKIENEGNADVDVGDQVREKASDSEFQSCTGNSSGDTNSVGCISSVSDSEKAQIGQDDLSSKNVTADQEMREPEGEPELPAWMTEPQWKRFASLWQNVLYEGDSNDIS